METLPQNVDCFWEVRTMDIILQVVLQSDHIGPDSSLSSPLSSGFWALYFWEIKKNMCVNVCVIGLLCRWVGGVFKAPISQTGA